MVIARLRELLMAAIAGMRVSQGKKFAVYHFYLKPLTFEGKLEKPSSLSPNVQFLSINLQGKL